MTATVGPLAIADPEAMHDWGMRLGLLLRAGDLVILTGSLGAGKTALTRGIGAGLGVRGPITSPTFVISRVHPSLRGGPDLVHVDAYRLAGPDEVDDLDLAESLDGAVMVVEWGQDKVEGLADSWLEVVIAPADPTGSVPGQSTAENEPAGYVPAGAGDDGDDVRPRTVLVTAVGPRWLGVELRTALTVDAAERPE